MTFRHRGRRAAVAAGRVGEGGLEVAADMVARVAAMVTAMVVVEGSKSRRAGAMVACPLRYRISTAA